MRGNSLIETLKTSEELKQVLIHQGVNRNVDSYGLVTLRTYRGHLCFEHLSIVGDCFRTEGTRTTRHGEPDKTRLSRNKVVRSD
jgi:hypothetical protein